MVELKKAQQIDAALESGIDRYSLILIHGNDAGLVHERALQFARATKVSLEDPFLCIRAEADQMLSVPGQLMDEARSISMFGGKRLIWLRLGSRNAVPACEALLEEPILEAIILLEAGELRSGHALRTLCEKSAKAICVVCYADESDDIARLGSDMIRQAGKAIEADALDLLAETLGSDRAVTRSEIEKLLLYMGERTPIRADDVAAILVDSSRLEPSAAIDAAFSGLVAEVEPTTRRILQDGMDAGVLLGMAYRHALSLMALLDMRKDGIPLRDAAKRQGIHFRREAELSRQLAIWTEERLVTVASHMNQGIAECRKAGPLSGSIGIRALWNVSLGARRANG